MSKEKVWPNLFAIVGRILGSRDKVDNLKVTDTMLEISGAHKRAVVTHTRTGNPTMTLGRRRDTRDILKDIARWAELTKNKDLTMSIEVQDNRPHNQKHAEEQRINVVP